MEEAKKIYSAISSVMKEIGAVGKNKKNTQGNGFMYRGIDDVMNALQPAMEKHGVFIVPEILDQSREERVTKSGGALIYSICKIKYTFYCEDGSNIQSVVIGEAMDSGDKATNKAMSVAFKYACFQVFCIPTEEMKDPDAETHTDLKPRSEENNINLTDKVKHEQVETLKSIMEKCNVNDASICDRYKVEKLEDMTQEMFYRAMKTLTKMKESKAK